MRQGRFDLILGAGGGSSLDTAKAAAILATNPGSVLDYTGIDYVPKAGIRLVLVPTTAGTGSEATRVFVMTDEAVNAKKVVYSDYLLPDLAILDHSDGLLWPICPEHNSFFIMVTFCLTIGMGR